MYSVRAVDCIVLEIYHSTRNIVCIGSKDTYVAPDIIVFG